MDLKVFAHRGEAQAFLKNQALKEALGPLSGLYRGDNFFLLIAGEGVQSVTQKLTHALALHPEINHITNLGVAGSLNELIPTMKMVSLRTLYRQHPQGIEFKSYTTDGGDYDGITTFQRVICQKEKEKLIPLADIVDREAWAIGSVAHHFGLPFSVHKLISDQANEGIETCHWVKDHAEIFSDKLYCFDREYDHTPAQNSNESTKESSLSDIEGLYFTVSQKRKYHQLIKRLSQKNLNEEDIFQNKKIKEILTKDLLPKKKTQLLLDELTRLLNPFHALINDQLLELSRVFENGNFKISYDRHLESDQVHLQAKISSPKHINDLITSLENYRYDLVQEIFKGKLDV